ncbi:hypothetical protein RA2_00472 [Roseovarius sp. A-2]|uniref:DUF1223 domain-containing protein n=1 Tax=Roseovarius sp. A-2 TaxID=1570360 RepID=UPI0009B570DF|nr:DUF1223 domain-containing protein [Roseovarius sp. A-2]GAW33436.1 hypothetical protein RA2_00472 [Roseovarius sp. A-2]
MRQILTTALAGLMMPVAMPGWASERPVVVELFTSQGCPSCPPADAFLEQLAERDDVLALSLHVDYWDYIGWTDTFGSPDHTARQRGYAKANERKMVYTPQMIINGADHVVGTRLKDVTNLIDEHHARSAVDIAVSLTQEGDTIHLSARTPEPCPMPLAVHLVRYLPEETVEIERGENAGKTITYVNIVTEMQTLAQWDTLEPLELSFGRPEGEAAFAVLLQYVDHGTIEAVARLP